jgi:hypothetical protein
MMKRLPQFLCVILMAITSAHAAQLYRWVDSKGNVEWRDTPPPATVPAKNIEQRRIGDSAPDASEVPFSVQLAAKNHPITLWVTDCGTPCTSARAHLGRRGIPFTEKAPQANVETFKKVSPDAAVPVLQVGTVTLTGYTESEWDSTLDYAGYPRTAIVTRPKVPAPAPAPKPAADGAKPATDAQAPAAK